MSTAAFKPKASSSDPPMSAQRVSDPAWELDEGEETEEERRLIDEARRSGSPLPHELIMAELDGRMRVPMPTDASGATRSS